MFRLWSLFACRDWCFGGDFTSRKARFRAVWLLRIAHTNNCFKLSRSPGLVMGYGRMRGRFASGVPGFAKAARAKYGGVILFRWGDDVCDR